MDENGEPFTFDLNLSIATTDLPQKDFDIFCNLFEGRFKYQLARRSHTSIEFILAPNRKKPLKHRSETWLHLLGKC